MMMMIISYILRERPIACQQNQMWCRLVVTKYLRCHSIASVLDCTSAPSTTFAPYTHDILRRYPEVCSYGSIIIDFTTLMRK